MASNTENVSIWWRHHEVLKVLIASNAYYVDLVSDFKPIILDIIYVTYVFKWSQLTNFLLIIVRYICPLSYHHHQIGNVTH